MKFMNTILAILLVGCLFVSASCSKEADDESTDSTINCDGNRTPQLAGPYLLKNNVPVDSDTEFSVNETIGVAIDFRDLDCNLAGGKIYAAINPVDLQPGDEGYQDFAPVVYIPTWAKCEGYVDDNADSNKLGFDVRLNSGERIIQVGIEDACGRKSDNFVETTVKVVND